MTYPKPFMSLADLAAFTGLSEEYLLSVYRRKDNDFAGKLEKATLDTIESGKMTKDLALITSLKEVQVLNSKEFILAVKTKLDELMA